MAEDKGLVSQVLSQDRSNLIHSIWSIQLV